LHAYDDAAEFEISSVEKDELPDEPTGKSENEDSSCTVESKKR